MNSVFRLLTILARQISTAQPIAQIARTAVLAFLVAWTVTGCNRPTSSQTVEPDKDAETSAPRESSRTAAESMMGAQGEREVLERPWTKGPSGKASFTDVTATTNIDFVHTDGGGEHQHISQTVTSGLALFDYDNDGLIDVYFLNGCEVPDTPLGYRPRNTLYRNNGDWSFTDVSTIAGVDDDGYGLGVAVADYDNDGDQDLYVNNFGSNVFYQNQGDGTFRNISKSSGTDNKALGAGVSWLDIEADGDLDLYVANYVDYSYANYKSRRVGHYEYAAAPGDYNAMPDALYRNNGDGTYSDISESSGVSSVASASMGTVAFDYDNDRDMDVFIACDSSANVLMQNDGTGHFSDAGVLSGFAHDLTGGDNGSMGVDAGDYNNDGRIDVFVTNYQGEMSVLYANVGGGFFSDMSRQGRIGAKSYPHVKWGATLADFDNDGDNDLFMVCGHFIEHIRDLDNRTDVKAPNFYLENVGHGTFVDRSEMCGNGLAVIESSRGAAFDDLDNDGDLDVVILNANGKPTLLRNDLVGDNTSLEIQLIGTTSNRNGVGAIVRLVSDQSEQVAAVVAGRGYQSHYGSTVHFGVPPDAKIQGIEVQWLGGQTQSALPPTDGENRLRILQKQTRVD